MVNANHASSNSAQTGKVTGKVVLVNLFPNKQFFFLILFQEIIYMNVYNDELYSNVDDWD